MSQDHSISGFRNAMIDYMRFISSIGIIAFHTKAPGSQVGYAGLAFFVILLAPLGLENLGRQKAPGFIDYASTRARRLLMPWLGWGLIYGAAKLAEMVVKGEAPSDLFEPWMLATGPAQHLWFLPFAFLGAIIFWIQFRLYRLAQTTGWGEPIGLLFAAISVGVIFFVPSDRLPIPFAQYLFALPSFLLGLSFAYQSSLALKLGVVVVIGVGSWAFGFPAGSLQLSIGGAAFLACLLLRLPETGGSRLAARLSLTIYLLHPLVLAVIERVAHLPSQGATIFLAGTIITIVAALALHVVSGMVSSRSLWRQLLGL